MINNSHCHIVGNKMFYGPAGHHPCVELNCNPSWFVVYTYVRQAVLEQQVKQAAFIYEQSNSLAIRDNNGSDSEQDNDDRQKDLIKIPQVMLRADDISAVVNYILV